MEKDDDSKQIGRRRSLLVFGLGVTVATGVLGLAGCKDEKPAADKGAAPASVDDCNALIDDTSKNLRKTLQYKTKSDNPDKVCAKCAQFTPEKFGACGGACKLIPGPVKPVGGCLSFAPIGSVPAGGAPAKTPT